MEEAITRERKKRRKGRESEEEGQEKWEDEGEGFLKRMDGWIIRGRRRREKEGTLAGLSPGVLMWLASKRYSKIGD